jgi:ABC-type lipoprotein release transport system permease subunit
MIVPRLALRNVLLGHPRARRTTLLIAASLCVLDLFAGHIAGERARLEYQAVVGERLGHLVIARTAGAAKPSGFDAAEAARLKRIAERVRGVALVVAQIHLTGVASTGRSSAVFSGAGIGPLPPDAPDRVREQPGLLRPDQANGIAVSSGQAASLGLRNGSAVTLTGVAPDAPPIPLNAQVVDIFRSSGFNANARSVLMPLDMAQALLDTGTTERLAVFLTNPKELETCRAALAGELQRAGLAVQVLSWRDLSAGYARAEAATSLEFLCVALAVLAVIWAALAATLEMNTHDRGRQLAALRALGMRPRGVVAIVTAEAVWITVAGVALSLAASGFIAWLVNRAVLPYAAQPGLSRSQMLVELDFNRMLLAFAAVLAVAVLAGLPPGVRAARAEVTRALRGEPGHPGW